ncbi:hypothetical protein Tco_0801256 [Tanacetum coccineum]|uniref:Uncharacterized protein n=1 Tax=Tanacetum coccineum TaxID=301880 RepID=A0ABQ4ZVK9_9ASTR
MTTLADKSLLSGGDNKPPMLEKHLYDSWKSIMELYMMNRPHGRMILASVEKGPLVWPSITEDGVTRLKEYVELTPAEAIQADCDIKAINIILQGLPTEIYALVSQHRVAKDLWEKIKLLMQGTSLTKQERDIIYIVIEQYMARSGMDSKMAKTCYHSHCAKNLGTKGDRAEFSGLGDVESWLVISGDEEIRMKTEGLESTSFTQGKVSSIPIGSSISLEGFLSFMLLLGVIIVMVVFVVVVLVVVVIAIVGVVIVVVFGIVVVVDVSSIFKLSFVIVDSFSCYWSSAYNVVEEEDGEWICFLGGNSSSGTKKYRGSNSNEGGNTGDRVKIAGEVIRSGDEIGAKNLGTNGDRAEFAGLGDVESDYEVKLPRVPLILGRPFLRTARVLIDVHGEELVIRDGMERIVFKPDGSQDKESIHMMDIYDDRVKDVCEPKSNDDSPTSTIVEEFESLLGDIIRQKEEVKGISDPVARRKACFKIMNQGRVIHSPKKASISAISHIFPNNNLEDSFKMGDEDLNFSSNKELDKEDLIPIPRESKIGKDCDFPLGDDFQSFKTFSNPLFEKKDDFPSRNDESILKEEVHKETLKSYLNPLFEDDEENISIEVSRQISPKVNSEPSIESLLNDDDDDLFEIDSNNDEWKRILYGEDFENKNSDSDKIKVFDKSSSNVFKSLSDELEPGSSSYVEGNDLDFHISDILFSTINEDKIFNPGIFDNVLPRKSSLTLDVFDPLHPPLMDFHVTKAFSGFSGFWKLHGSILWKDKAIPTISIDGLQSSLHKWENSYLLSLFFIELTSILLARP